MHSFLLHSASFSERGDGVTLLALGCLLRDELGAKVVFAVPEKAVTVSEIRLGEAKALNFEILRYRDKVDLDNFAIRNSITHTYVFSGGRREDLPYFNRNIPGSFQIANTFHITHAVFRNFDPHGDVYAYVSSWLFKSSLRRYFFKYLMFRFKSNTVKKPELIALPHFIDWSASNKESHLELRKKYGISENNFIVGRIGGYKQFDDPAARAGVKRLLVKNPDFWVFCVNTEPFFEHPRLIYLNELTRAEVLAFYKACDVLVNGRLMGESLGYSIIEPLSQGKPVIAPHWIRNPLMDKNHVSILTRDKALYTSARHFASLVKKFAKSDLPADHWKALVESYSREKARLDLERILLRLQAN